jgi:hypothetical protein
MTETDNLTLVKSFKLWGSTFSFYLDGNVLVEIENGLEVARGKEAWENFEEAQERVWKNDFLATLEAVADKSWWNPGRLYRRGLVKWLKNYYEA